eukprot:3284005-Lingulodinium_polyedra.AAC.1
MQRGHDNRPRGRTASLRRRLGRSGTGGHHGRADGVRINNSSSNRLGVARGLGPQHADPGDPDGVHGIEGPGAVPSLAPLGP